MTVHELTISTEYVPDWGIWEGVREFYQNALDANDRGNRMKVFHNGKGLVLINEGADIPLASLLLGVTDKRGVKGMRGEKGEGMDLAMLALTRAGITLFVKTKTETWEPKLGRSEKWGRDILSIHTRKHKANRPETGVTVQINIPAKTWEELKVNFVSEEDEDEKVKTSYGTILLRPEEKGRLYSKGIWVQTRDDLKYGYDLLNVSVDRDRRVLQEFDLKWTLSSMYAEAVSTDPDKMTRKLWLLVQEGAGDVSGFTEYTASQKVRKEMKKCWEEKYGDAILVSSIDEGQTVAHHGYRGVMATPAMKILLSEVKTARQLTEEKVGSTSRIFDWGDLDESQKDALSFAFSEIDKAILYAKEREFLGEWVFQAVSKMEGGYLKVTTVAEFNDTRLMGATSKNGITIGIKSLQERLGALLAAIHEVAHWETKAPDGDARHSHLVEHIWAAVLGSRGSI